MQVCPITSVAVDSEEELDETCFLKMREKLKLKGVLMGPSGHAPVPRVALIPPFQIEQTQVRLLTSIISWLGRRGR